MKRRKFLGRSIAGGVVLGASPALAAPAAAQVTSAHRSELPANVNPAAYANRSSGYNPFATPDYYTYADDLVIERNRPGKPHQGKVLAAIQAHSDDIPLFAGGLVAKLIDEGYTGYLIRISNDESAGQNARIRRCAERDRLSGSGEGAGMQEGVLVLLPQPSHG